MFIYSPQHIYDSIVSDVTTQYLKYRQTKYTVYFLSQIIFFYQKIFCIDNEQSLYFRLATSFITIFFIVKRLGNKHKLIERKNFFN